MKEREREMTYLIQNTGKLSMELRRRLHLSTISLQILLIRRRRMGTRNNPNIDI